MSHAIQVSPATEDAPATTRWLVEITVEAEVIPGPARDETEVQS